MRSAGQRISKNILFLLCICMIQQTSLAGWEKMEFPTIYINSIESTPWGLIAGEYDTRIWMNPPPYNGIYLSKDLGKTWLPIGLQSRGIIDMKYYSGNIYATTYYVSDNKVGLYYSKDTGKTWEQIGPMISPTKVNRDSQTVYLGSEHHGLWVSLDGGNNWEQKIGNGTTGPFIKAIESSEDITFVSTIDKTYFTIDKGVSWNEIPFLNGKGIEHFYITDKKVVFAGSSGVYGLYKSYDLGNTWEKITSFGNYAVGDIIYSDNVLYAGRINPLMQTQYSVVKSTDLGNSWLETDLNIPSYKRVLDLSMIFFKPKYLFALSLNNGIYRYEVSTSNQESFPFLNIPWKEGRDIELIDNITSFFDHRYPLLGYTYWKEPVESKDLTLNFMNEEEKIPTLYYSSHNGIDYALSYGKEITAPAGGLASYYYCSSCGNSIRIDHMNGFETIYMHLQKSGLISEADPVQVEEDQVIGKVGMTGNTNGPHLHFQVLKDKDYPDGLVDPYGWKPPSNETDPWSIYSWTDILGGHIGNTSVDLWKNTTQEKFEIIHENKTVILDNKTLKWEGSLINPILISMRSYVRPHIPESQINLSYINETSLLLNAFDFLGNKIITPEKYPELIISFTRESIKNIIPQTIQFYFWNETTSLWNPLPTILDLVSLNAKTNLEHFSKFILMGEKIDTFIPNTSIDISGVQSNGWYQDYPEITLSTENNGAENNLPVTIFYTTSGETGWEEYTVPILMEKDGIIEIQYRSMKENGNIEPTNKIVLKINTKNKNTKKLSIKNSIFHISESIE